MKRILTAAILGSLIAATSFAQAPATPAAPTPAPTIDQILDKYVAAIGGAAALEKLNSRVSKGVFEVPDQGAAGSIEIYAKAPNLTLTVIDIEGFGSIRNAWDGSRGWTDNPQAGLNDYTPEQTASAKLGSFYLPIKLREFYPKMSGKGSDKVANRDVWVVEAAPAEGSPRLFSFDAENGLLVRAVSERDSPAGPVKIETYFSNYKDVDGVKLPFMIRQVNPQFSSVVTLSDIKHNLPIDDAKFKKPM